MVPEINFYSGRLFNFYLGKLMKKILVVAALATVVATPAIAADAGFYLGGSVGQSNTKLDNTSLTKKTDTSFALLGGINVSQNLAVEVQYSDMGKVSYSGGSVELSALSVTAVVSAPVNTDVSIFGKLGIAKTYAKEIASGIKANRSTATFGLGGQYNLDSNLGVRLGWDRYAVGDTTNIPEGDTDMIYAGVVFKF